MIRAMRVAAPATPDPRRPVPDAEKGRHALIALIARPDRDQRKADDPAIAYFRAALFPGEMCALSARALGITDKDPVPLGRRGEQGARIDRSARRGEDRFAPMDNAPAVIRLRASAQLDRSGAGLRCDRGFQFANGDCGLER